TITEPAQLIPRKQRYINKAPKTSKEQKIFDRHCQLWYDKYKDSDNSDIMGPDGCQAFFSDIGVSLESITPLIIAWKMNCSRMGYITKNEWQHGMKALNVENESKLKVALSTAEQCIEKHDKEFEGLYNFCYPYAKSENQKSMDVEVAIALWQVLLVNKYPIVKSFIQFLQEKKPVKVINKDQWRSLLEFGKNIPEDLSGYDPVSYWPVLFDDFVEWKKKQE
ncbi:hypothetical protein CU097_014076, partial [Rhizopus azygosporus]